MKTAFIRLFVALVLAVPRLAVPAFAGEKPLPPAFGRELVPDEETNERNESKSGEIEDEKEEAETRAARHSAPHVTSHGRIHIQLDGDEDGGGDDSDDDDGL